jgi:hypothetical protein
MPFKIPKAESIIVSRHIPPMGVWFPCRREQVVSVYYRNRDKYVLTCDLTASTLQENSLSLPVKFTYAWLLWLKRPTRHNEIRLRFEVLVVRTLIMFQNAMTYSLLHNHQPFWWICCLHLQGKGHSLFYPEYGCNKFLCLLRAHL